MAQMIDMAQKIEGELNQARTQVQILPSERICDEDYSNMKLIQLDDGLKVLRIHRCPTCGYERRYGGYR